MSQHRRTSPTAAEVDEAIDPLVLRYSIPGATTIARLRDLERLLRRGENLGEDEDPRGGGASGERGKQRETAEDRARDERDEAARLRMERRCVRDWRLGSTDGRPEWHVRMEREIIEREMMDEMVELEELQALEDLLVSEGSISAMHRADRDCVPQEAQQLSSTRELPVGYEHRRPLPYPGWTQGSCPFPDTTPEELPREPGGWDTPSPSPLSDAGVDTPRPRPSPTAPPLYRQWIFWSRDSSTRVPSPAQFGVLSDELDGVGRAGMMNAFPGAVIPPNLAVLLPLRFGSAAEPPNMWARHAGSPLLNDPLYAVQQVIAGRCAGWVLRGITAITTNLPALHLLIDHLPPDAPIIVIEPNGNAILFVAQHVADALDRFLGTYGTDPGLDELPDSAGGCTTAVVRLNQLLLRVQEDYQEFSSDSADGFVARLFGQHVRRTVTGLGIRIAELDAEEGNHGRDNCRRLHQGPSSTPTSSPSIRAAYSPQLYISEASPCSRTSGQVCGGGPAGGGATVGLLQRRPDESALVPAGTPLLDARWQVQSLQGGLPSHEEPEETSTTIEVHQRLPATSTSTSTYPVRSRSNRSSRIPTIHLDHTRPRRSTIRAVNSRSAVLGRRYRHVVLRG